MCLNRYHTKRCIQNKTSTKNLDSKLLILIIFILNSSRRSFGSRRDEHDMRDRLDRGGDRMDRGARSDRDREDRGRDRGDRGREERRDRDRVRDRSQ